MREIERVVDELRIHGPMAIAVSGGVDSMTLAVIAHRRIGDMQIFHAVSPAVPHEATERVRHHARREAWHLLEIGAGEFDDPSYVANPVDRCFHCKRNLYETIAANTSLPIASGANTDDLDDYRPGLQAAREADVVHPFVEAGIGKTEIRAMAAELGLKDLAELPAAPCLSSRIETGIAVEPQWLTTIDAVEMELRSEIDADTIRCRLRDDRVSIELDAEALAALSPTDIDRLGAAVRRHWAEVDMLLPVRFEPYRRGSAFLRVRS
jgi:uncharacterized protein